jgi:hypothetical protein
MYKKDLKKYEAPVTEVISTELEGLICTSPGKTNADGITKDLDENSFDYD